MSFYKLLNENPPSYLVNLIPNLNSIHETRQNNNIPAVHTRHNYFKNSFFPSTISEWNNLDCQIRKSGSLSIFKKNLLNCIRPFPNSIFNIHNPYGIKLLKRLRLSLSHLHDHQIRHCFQDIMNPLCDCGINTETMHTFFSTVQVSILPDKPSWITLKVLTNRPCVIIMSCTCFRVKQVAWMLRNLLLEISAISEV